MTDPLHVAIVGSGPSGFYAAGQLLKAIPGCAVELFDRLPTPFGLVRAGVAPDHPKIKSVTRVFERIAGEPGFRFHGNVEVGRDVTHRELLAHHHAVLYCIGAARDRRLGIPGEDLPGSLAATAFVGWYNGHPDFAELEPDLSTRRAVVVGNGNVALDVARMLLLPHEELKVTDIADHALAALERSAIEEVVVLGRRGPAEAAYTTPELLELGELSAADVIVDPAQAEVDATERTRKVEIVQEYARRPPAGKDKRIVLRFLASPVELLGRECVTGVKVVRNVLDDQRRARPTGEHEILEAGLVLRSVGYRGTELDGLPFDQRAGTIHNAGGRVTAPGTGEPLPGVYTAGWVKRGPSGVIGTNKKDAQDTVDRLLEDLEAGRLNAPQARPDTLLEAIRARRSGVVDFAGWGRIDAHEQAAGEPHGRPRVKLVRLDEHLRVAAR